MPVRVRVRVRRVPLAGAAIKSLRGLRGRLRGGGLGHLLLFEWLFATLDIVNGEERRRVTTLRNN